MLPLDRRHRGADLLVVAKSSRPSEWGGRGRGTATPVLVAWSGAGWCGVRHTEDPENHAQLTRRSSWRRAGRTAGSRAAPTPTPIAPAATKSAASAAETPPT